MSRLDQRVLQYKQFGQIRKYVLFDAATVEKLSTKHFLEQFD